MAISPSPSFSSSSSSSTQGPAFPEFAGQAGGILDEALDQSRKAVVENQKRLEAYENVLRSLKNRAMKIASGAVARGGGVNPQSVFRAALLQAADAGIPYESQIAANMLSQNANLNQFNNELQKIANAKTQLASIQQGKSSSQSTSQGPTGGSGGGGSGRSMQSTGRGFAQSRGMAGYAPEVLGRKDGWTGDFIGIGPGPGMPNPGFLGSSEYARAGTYAQNAANIKKRMQEEQERENAARQWLANRYRQAEIAPVASSADTPTFTPVEPSEPVKINMDRAREWLTSGLPGNPSVGLPVNMDRARQYLAEGLPGSQFDFGLAWNQPIENFADINPSQNLQDLGFGDRLDFSFTTPTFAWNQFEPSQQFAFGDNSTRFANMFDDFSMHAPQMAFNQFEPTEQFGLGDWRLNF